MLVPGENKNPQENNPAISFGNTAVQPAAPAAKPDILDPKKMEIRTMQQDLKSNARPIAPPPSFPIQPNFPATAGQNNIPPAANLKTAETDKKGINFGKIMLIATVAIIILAAGGGGYWFWITRNREPIVAEMPVIAPPPVPVPDDIPVVPEGPKPKYMNLDLSVNTPPISTLIATYIQDSKAAATTTPLEFIVSDTNNNPIAFKDFAQKLGITLPAEIISALENEFSFFLYNDNGNTGLALAIDAGDELALQASLKKEEPNLVKDFNSFLGLITDAAGQPLVFNPNIKVVFKSGTYNGFPDNYFNIIDNKTLSLDYGVANSQLVIATTMLTFRSVVDFTQTQDASAVIPSDIEEAPAIIPPQPTAPTFPNFDPAIP